MRHLTTAALVVACAVTACASSEAHSPLREQFVVEIAFQVPDGTRVVAPRLTCFADQRANVSVAKEYTYIKDYDVEVLQDDFRADPVKETLHEGVWLDMKAARGADQQIELQYRLRRTALKRPIEKFETTLGAFTKPVTIEIPRLLSDDLSGTCRLVPGVESQLVRLPVHDGVEALSVLARVSCSSSDDAIRPGDDINLDPR